MPSTTISTISRANLTKPPAVSAKVTDFKNIASYSWWNTIEPTISVPGCPPLWSPPSTVFPRPLEPDSGTVYIDQNAARCPSSPLEPLFRAVLIENHDLFLLRDVDLVTDRNNIRKLLRFVQGSSNEPFQIRVEIVGGDDGDDDDHTTTALFTRVEPKTTEAIQGFRGYGRNFEKAYTKKPESANGYHRIVAYSFGGMRFVVRHETDAYTRPDNQGTDTLSDAELADAFRGVSLAEEAPVNKTTSGLTVVKWPKPISPPPSSILEIKTRAASRVLDMGDVLPQLWISQTPKLAVGYHHKGVFNDVRVRSMAAEITRWEERSQGDLGKLAGLLTDIISAVKGLRGSARRAAVVEYTGGSSLRVVASAGDDAKPALPDDLYAMWKSLGLAAAEPVEAVDKRDSGKGKHHDEKPTATS